MSLFDKDAWVVVNEDGEPLGQDSSSGGYPYLPPGLNGVYYFNTMSGAEAYLSVFKDSRLGKSTPVSVVQMRLVRVY